MPTSRCDWRDLVDQSPQRVTCTATPHRRRVFPHPAALLRLAGCSDRGRRRMADRERRYLSKAPCPHRRPAGPTGDVVTPELVASASRDSGQAKHHGQQFDHTADVTSSRRPTPRRSEVSDGMSALFMEPWAPVDTNAAAFRCASAYFAPLRHRTRPWRCRAGRSSAALAKAAATIAQVLAQGGVIARRDRCPHCCWVPPSSPTPSLVMVQIGGLTRRLCRASNLGDDAAGRYVAPQSPCRREPAAGTRALSLYAAAAPDLVDGSFQVVQTPRPTTCSASCRLPEILLRASARTASWRASLTSI